MKIFSSAFFEQYFPIIFGIIVAVAHLLFFRNYNLPINKTNEVKDVLSAVVSLSGITIGFLAATQSILLSMGNTRIIRLLKSGEAKKYKTLINYLMQAINWSFLLAIMSLVGILFNPKTQDIWNSPICSFWLLLLVTALLSYFRIIKLFSEILKFPT